MLKMIASPLNKSTNFTRNDEINFLISLICSLKGSQIFTLNHIINQNMFFDFRMYEAQETIAKKLGICRQTVNEHIKKLSSMGLLEIRNHIDKGFNCGTKQYIPSKLLFKYKFHLYNFLPSLRKASWMTLKKLGLLISPFQGFKTRMVTPTPTPYKKTIRNLYNNKEEKKLKREECKFVPDVLHDGQLQILNLIQKLTINKVKGNNMAIPVGKLLISPILKEITDTLKLNRLGQIKLIIFDEEVLRNSWERLSKKPKVHSKLEFLVNSCVNLCNENNISIDWNIYYTLLRRYDIKDNHQYYQKSHFEICGGYCEIFNNSNCKYVQPQKSVLMFDSQAAHPAPTSYSVTTPRWKTLQTDKPHPEFAKYFEQKLLNDAL